MKTRVATLLSGIATAGIPASALAHSYEDSSGFWPHDGAGGCNAARGELWGGNELSCGVVANVLSTGKGINVD